jgi:branched-chain amino acid transport system ATP-binding protein
MSYRMQTILSGVSITKKFGGLMALKDVNFKVKKGEIVGLIGPNGAGKTTLFNLISGMFPPTKGKIYFEGKDITHLKPHQICRLGIARTFQLVRPFHNISVLENITSGALFGRNGTIDLKEAQERVSSITDFIGLKRKDALAKNLTIHEKKMLELARALASNPKVVLIDEVMAGLNSMEVEETMKLIGRIRDELGITVFWIEHVMKAVMGLAERVIVLSYGEVIADGKPAEVANLPAVIDVYLGEKLVE